MERGAHRRALGDLDRPLRLQLGRAEDARQGRLLEDPERRPGAREPAADDPPLRRPRRAGSSLNRMVELLATNPAKLFGLYPRKGTLAVGSDADIVVFDPEKRVTISAATHHSQVDYNLYEGTEVQGSPEVVLLRGNVLVEDGELVAKPGHRPVRQARAVRRGAEAGGARAGVAAARPPPKARDDPAAARGARARAGRLRDRRRAALGRAPARPAPRRPRAFLRLPRRDRPLQGPRRGAPDPGARVRRANRHG